MKGLKKITAVILSVFIIFGLCACSNNNEDQVKNIILFIGDGMGENHIYNTSIKYGELTLQNMEVNNHSITYSYNNAVTDSAAGATALSTGYKTRNEVVGKVPVEENGELEDVVNLVEAAREEGKRVGVVTTDEVTGATPGSFTAHTDSRENAEDIAAQQLELKANVLFGGYNAAFTDSAVEEADFDGYVKNKTELQGLSDEEYVLGLFGADELKACSTENDTPTILEMTQKSIDLLDEGKDGFFLMVEGACIDKASHENNLDLAMQHTKAMDEALAYALDYAEKDGNTLVVVTADHETGGLMKPAKDNEDYLFNTLYTTYSHTNADVPLMAEGKKSEVFNTEESFVNFEIAKTLASLMGIEDFGYDGTYDGPVEN